MIGMIVSDFIFPSKIISSVTDSVSALVTMSKTRSATSVTFDGQRTYVS